MGKKKGSGRSAADSEVTANTASTDTTVAGAGRNLREPPQESTPLFNSDDIEYGAKGRISSEEYSEAVVHRMRQSKWYFGYCVGSTVLATFLIIAMLTGLVHPVRPEPWFLVCEALLTFAIVAEVTWIGYYLGCSAKDPWFVFDVVVAVISIMAFLLDLLLSAMSWQMDEYVLAILATRYCIQVARMMKFFKDAWRSKQEQDAADDLQVAFGSH